ncbi:MAG: hypothetical protein ACE3L7_25660 [Candidatus Pristimantibacillus sp.]
MSKVLECRDLEADLVICEAAVSDPVNIPTFIRQACTGWPYAIKRAMDAEKEIDSLRNELSILQEQRQGRGCWD